MSVPALLDPLVVSLERRWYVALFLVTYLVLALRHLGARRTLLFSGVAAAISWLSEVPSIRVGFPYGLYTYHWQGADGSNPTGLDPREPALLGVPCLSTLSYVFLNYAALCCALVLLGRREPPAGFRGRAALAALSAALVVAIDTVVDPIALRGGEWFLGKMYFYPHGGEHWGVPISNYAGWLLVGSLIAGLYLALEARLAAPPPARAGGAALGTALFFSVLAFNIGVTFFVGARDLGWSSAAIAAPLLVLSLARAGLTDPGGPSKLGAPDGRGVS